MSELTNELISGKDAFDAAYNGSDAEWRWKGKEDMWRELKPETAFSINELKGAVCEFRLKPKTISLNGREVPAPFTPVVGEVYYYINPRSRTGYSKTKFTCSEIDSYSIQYGAYRTEDEIKQIREALRSVFGGNK